MLLSTAGGQPAAMTSPQGTHALVLYPTGVLSLLKQPEGTKLFSVGPFKACKAPFAARLLPNGALVVEDKKGAVLWASASACMGAFGAGSGGGSAGGAPAAGAGGSGPVCYGLDVLDSGAAVITDADGSRVWSTAGPGASSADAPGVQQLLSGGSPAVSCVSAGPPATYLLSQDGAFSLAVRKAGAELLDLAGGSVWSAAPPAGSPAPQRFCLAANGTLQLLAAGAGGAQLWASGYAVPVASLAAGSFAARVSNDGCLEVYDGACSLLYSSSAKKRGGAAPLPPPLRSSVRKARGAAPPRRTGSAALPPKAAATKQASAPRQRAPAPSRKPPAPRKRASVASKQAQAKLLPAGQVCGGINLCGINGACRSAGRCGAGLACRSFSNFTWTCQKA